MITSSFLDDNISVDTAGGGIRKMFLYQRDRLFPMPEYELGADRVEVRITGKVLDLGFATILARKKDLSLEEIILLDKVQKRKPLTHAELDHLRKRRLVEGRKPNVFFSLGLAKAIGKKADYTKNRGLNRNAFIGMLKDGLEQHGEMNRAELDELLLQYLPNNLSHDEKRLKLTNLLSRLRMKGVIENRGTRSKPRWALRPSLSAGRNA